jgi:hypothetical protein
MLLLLLLLLLVTVYLPVYNVQYSIQRGVMPQFSRGIYINTLILKNVHINAYSYMHIYVSTTYSTNLL